MAVQRWLERSAVVLRLKSQGWEMESARASWSLEGSDLMLRSGLPHSVVWYVVDGVVWLEGLVWCVVVWCGWCGVLQFGVVGVVCCSVVWLVWCGVVGVVGVVCCSVVWLVWCG